MDAAAVAALESLRAATEHLPPGIRFSPTDQEAVVNYLQPGRGYYGGFTVVPQIDICKWEPVDLPMQFKSMYDRLYALVFCLLMISNCLMKFLNEWCHIYIYISS